MAHKHVLTSKLYETDARNQAARLASWHTKLGKHNLFTHLYVSYITRIKAERISISQSRPSATTTTLESATTITAGSTESAIMKIRGHINYVSNVDRRSNGNASSEWYMDACGVGEGHAAAARCVYIRILPRGPRVRMCIHVWWRVRAFLAYTYYLA